jgi:hypothetical protein
MPGTLDMPEAEIIIIDKPDPRGPFGAEGVGEPALVGVAPAIGNAIYDAVGVRITELPITPEKVITALKAKSAWKDRGTAMTNERAIKVLIAKPGLDGHNRGARTLTLGLRDEGMEVIYIGLRKPPEEIVDRAAKATEERAAEL